MATALTECLFVVPEGFSFRHKYKCDQGPSDNLIDASHKATKEPGFEHDIEFKGRLAFYTDYNVGDHNHWRYVELTKKEGKLKRYRYYCYPLAVQWLPKNRAHLLCLETSGVILIIKNYNYRNGKGDVYVYSQF